MYGDQILSIYVGGDIMPVDALAILEARTSTNRTAPAKFAYSRACAGRVQTVSGSGINHAKKNNRFANIPTNLRNVPAVFSTITSM